MKLEVSLLKSLLFLKVGHHIKYFMSRGLSWVAVNQCVKTDAQQGNAVRREMLRNIF